MWYDENNENKRMGFGMRFQMACALFIGLSGVFSNNQNLMLLGVIVAITGIGIALENK